MTTDRGPVVEWRHGWWREGGFGVDWKEWGFSFALTLTWRKEIGLSGHLGPFYAYVSWEEEDRLFEDGVDSGMATAPVSGYANRYRGNAI